MNLDAKVSSLIASADAGAEPASDAPAAAPPSGASSGVDSAPAAVDASGQATEAAAPTLAEVLREKLAKTREARQAQRAEQRAREARSEAARIAAEAKADREAAAAEKARWEGLKNGTFLDGIKALGKDPREAFAEMQAEAIEAGTPEAQQRRMREEFDRQLKAETERVARELREELAAEKAAAAEQALAARFESDFVRAVADPAYEALRDEYEDEAIFGYANALRAAPQQLYALAGQLGVRLTDPSKGFTMRDILNVLRAKQAEHIGAAERRRAARTAAAPPPSQAAPHAARTPSPTVNGTAASRNAGATTIGNDLATERASDGKFVPKGSTASARLRERVRRLSGG
jgi:hypothetical protein